MSMDAKFTERDASIVTQASHKVAAKLLRLELEHECIKLPATPAKRLEAIEARYDKIVKRLVTAALLPYVTGEIDLDLPEGQQPQKEEPKAGEGTQQVSDDFEQDIPF